jgi:hypothetical protein
MMVLRLLLCVLWLDLASAVYIRLVDFDVKPVLGTERTLECVADDVPNSASYVIQWYKGGELLTQTQQDSIDKYGGLGTLSLVIRSLVSADDGEYECAVITGPSTKVTSTKSFNLQVVYGYGTTVVINDASIFPIMGQWHVLVCQITSQGKPTTPDMPSWYHDGTKLTLSQQVDDKYVDIGQGLKLKINTLTKEDSGLYECRKDNGVPGGKVIGHPLKVRYKPDKPVVLPLDRTFQAGGNITLTCHVSDPGYPEVDTFTWLNNKRDQLSQQQIPDYVISWDDVKTEEIRCQASNDIIESDLSEIVTVSSVAVPVINTFRRTTDTPDEVSLECSVSGTSQSTVIWSKDGKVISNSDHYNITYKTTPSDGILTSLHISAKNSAGCLPQDHYNGKYMCNAKKTIGGEEIIIQSTSESVEIQSRLTWDMSVKPEVRSPVGSKHAYLVCAVCGVESDQNVTWRYEGGELPDGIEYQENKLYIKSVQAKHLGHYECLVEDSSKVASMSGDTVKSFPIVLSGKLSRDKILTLHTLRILLILLI